MKPILHNIEYELEDGSGESIDGQDITSAYAKLIETEEIGQLLEEGYLIESLSEILADDPSFRDEDGLSRYWRAYGADLIEDLCESLECTEKPDPDDHEAVRSLAEKWLGAYAQSSMGADHLERIAKKASTEATNFVHEYDLHDPSMRPVMENFLAHFVVIEGFEEALKNAIARNQDGDPIKAMQIAQNISNAFRPTS